MENLEEFRIPQEALEKLKDPLYVKNQVAEGRTFQEILGFTLKTMDKFYSAAYNLFQRQQYEEAADAFVFLTTLNPRIHTYWVGLGMSEQLNEEYDAALMAYSMAILTNVENPLPHYHSAACYHALQEKENAVASLEMALQHAGVKEEYAHIKKHAQATLDSLKKS